MGKKGKVELKRKRQAFFAQKRKERRKERRARLKTRKPLNQDLANVQDGIAEIIRERGAEPTPTAYFACLLSLIQTSKDPKRLPYFLALLDIYVADVSEGLLSKSCLQIMDNVITITKQFLADSLIVKKGFRLMSTLFAHLTPTRGMFAKYLSMEPHRLNTDHMPRFLYALQNAVRSAHASAPDLVHEMFDKFVDVFSSNFADAPEPVANAAARALKNMLEHTVNLALIKSPAQPVQKTLQHLLKMQSDAQCRNNWDHIAECQGVLLNKLAMCKCNVDVVGTFPMIAQVVSEVDQLRQLDDFHYNHAAEACLGSGLRCLGARAFLDLVPLDTFSMDPIAGRHYLLPILRRRLSHDNMAFFLERFAPMITQCRRAEEEAIRQGKHLEAKTLNQLHQQVWQLLPGFATFPKDLADGTTYKVVARELTKLLQDPDLCKVVVKTFVVLIEKSRYLAEYEPEEEEEMDDDEESDEEDEEDEDDEDDDGRDEEMDKEFEGKKEAGEDDGASQDALDDIEAKLPELLETDFCEAPPEADPLTFHMISKDRAAEYLKLIGSFGKNIIPLLCNSIEKEVNEDKRVLLLTALRSYASVADKAVLNTVFKQVSRTLIESQHAEAALTEEQMRRNHVMMDIGCVLAEFLDDEALKLLITLVEPLLASESDDFLLQKRSYKVLSRVCRSRGDVVRDSVDRVVELLHVSRLKCDSASKRERLNCFINAVVIQNEYAKFDEMKRFISTTVPEVMLALKEVNTRTRDTAFSCLAAYAELSKVNNFTKMLMAGLAGTTPSLVSCTIITLSKMMHEYHTEIEPSYLNAIIVSCIKLVRHKSNEIKNAAMSFTRLALKLVPHSTQIREVMEANLLDIITGCITWTSQKRLPGNTRRHVALIIERCIKRFGYDRMAAIFPEEHRRYLDYIEKQRKMEIKKALKEREKRKESAKERREKFNNMFFEGGREKMQMGDGDDGLDLLDDGFVRSNFVTTQGRGILSEQNDRGEKDEFHASFRDGKMVIQTESEFKREKREDLLNTKISQMDGTRRAALEELGAQKTGEKTRKRKFDDEDDAHDINELYEPEAAAARQEFRDLQAALKGPSKKERPRTSKRLRVESDVRTGSQFRAKPGSFGDIKKGGVDPYAYVPLNAKYLNKRHRMKAISRVKAVSETARKGKAPRK